MERHEIDNHEDPLAPARGCALGVLLGAICWALIGGAFWLACA